MSTYRLEMLHKVITRPARRQRGGHLGNRAGFEVGELRGVQSRQLPLGAQLLADGHADRMRKVTVLRRCLFQRIEQRAEIAKIRMPPQRVGRRAANEGVLILKQRQHHPTMRAVPARHFRHDLRRMNARQAILVRDRHMARPIKNVALGLLEIMTETINLGYE